MHIEDLIAYFGYYAIFVGTFLEGETILVLAGFAAHQGYLSFPGVIAAAFAGTVGGDQLFYFLGRHHADRLLRRFPRWQPRVLRARTLIDRYRVLLILSFRFLYGLRTVIPFALGTSGIHPRLFIPLNLLGAALWTVVVGGAGYFFGQILEVLLGRLKHLEWAISLAILAVGLLLWWRQRWRRRKEGERG